MHREGRGNCNGNDAVTEEQKRQRPPNSMKLIRATRS